jgi:hypothetical protein
MPPDFDSYQRINRQAQGEAERRNERYYAASRERRTSERREQHEREMEQNHHGNNAGLLITVGALSLSLKLRRGFGFLVLAVVVGGFLLTVLGTVAHEIGGLGLVVLAFGALMSFIWLVSSVLVALF